ncbi:nitroreductase family deazaflavin-dependent oxidoreductase [Nakamurella endophytica]|uniref:F420H(2)-dependent quinone reductase n=1 Tax=Nakamurella endophytica TaxID=1748367 RepID=A0A917T2W0_9ACTN|nr:nitroreductase family deazaflavin-dependent oxidoreductase [Nakamurella endophytica]GGM08625.1 putative F420H(2)-dependent quinone reductase [Nakamurella endophytica]
MAEQVARGQYLRGASDWAADQAEQYEESNGQEATTLRGVPIMLVSTTGRRTGALRRTPLMRVEHQGSYAAVASKGGAPDHPVWYLNILADPVVTVRDGAQVGTYRAHTAEGAERDRWWERAVAVWPDYAEYQTKTDRQIPVVVLDPVE